ncbi:MAG: sugar phosphate isomerase/epimerase [Planctomycetes bacterium]|nr:sugar phosphate isomerase/epimerase [Planctomycetota bacterium]
MKIGVRTVCLRMSWDEVLTFCRDIGLDGIQVAPKEHGLIDLSEAERKEFADKVKSFGLEISGASAGPNLVDPKVAEQSVAQFKSFLKLAVDLGPGIVTGEVKAVPEGVSEEAAWAACIASVKEVCNYAQEIGARYAVEPGPHCLVKDADTMLRLIESVGHECLGVNYDPANVNSAGSDAVADARRVAPHIIHTHAKDSRRTADRPEETILGEGDVDFKALIQVYRDAGFDGWLCIERERSDNTAEDVRKSKALLDGIMGT